MVGEEQIVQIKRAHPIEDTVVERSQAWTPLYSKTLSQTKLIAQEIETLHQFQLHVVVESFSLQNSMDINNQAYQEMDINLNFLHHIARNIGKVKLWQNHSTCVFG